MPLPADLIVINARILTMDDANPRAEAIALSDGRIAAVGALVVWVGRIRGRRDL